MTNNFPGRGLLFLLWLPMLLLSLMDWHGTIDLYLRLVSNDSRIIDPPFYWLGDRWLGPYPLAYFMLLLVASQLYVRRYNRNVQNSRLELVTVNAIPLACYYVICLTMTLLFLNHLDYSWLNYAQSSLVPYVALGCAGVYLTYSLNGKYLWLKLSVYLLFLLAMAFFDVNRHSLFGAYSYPPFLVILVAIIATDIAGSYFPYFRK